MKKPINKKYVFIAIAVIYVIIFITGILLIVLQDDKKIKSIGLILIVMPMVILIPIAAEIRNRAKENKSYSVMHISEIKTPHYDPTAKPVVEKKPPLIAHEGKITAINQEDRVNLNIWGEVRAISVSSQRILYDDSLENEGAGAPLNDKELEELNWLIESKLIESEEIKSVILKYVNLVTEDWDDDYYEGKITSILPPEVEINDILIDIRDTGETIIAFCGECLCDEEHGISVTFLNRKFAGVGVYMDFEYAVNWDLFNGKEKKCLPYKSAPYCATKKAIATRICSLISKLSISARKRQRMGVKKNI